MISIMLDEGKWETVAVMAKEILERKGKDGRERIGMEQLLGWRNKIGSIGPAVEQGEGFWWVGTRTPSQSG